MGISSFNDNSGTHLTPVTGGAQGLGLVCARALLEHGVEKLAIFDVDESKGAKAIEHFKSICKSEKPTVLFKNVDVSNEDSVNEAVADVSRSFNGIDILVCFAGITGSELAIEYDIESWRRIFDVNVHGSFLVARAVARSSFSFHFSPNHFDSFCSQSGQGHHRTESSLHLHHLHRFHVRLHRQPTPTPLRLRHF